MSDTANTLFPVLDPATEAALRASIERFGVLVPVIVDQDGRLLDGNNRYRIANELGAECPTQTHWVADDDERAEIMRTLNCDRRQMSREQRTQVAAHLRERGDSLRRIADVVGVSQEQVRHDLSTVKDLTVPERIVGLDGKSRPAHSVRPGDVVVDDNGQPRHVAEIEEHGDDLILHDGDGDALVVPREKEVRRLTKPDLGGGVSHPARFSQELVETFARLLSIECSDLLPADEVVKVLDPFAGTGRIHWLMDFSDRWDTTGVEIEPEWAGLHERTVQGNATILGFPDGSFDAIVTSPTYGNRLADHHEAADASLRRSYRHDLGRPLDENNSGQMHWGAEYRALHERAWSEAVRVLRPGGRFVLNVKDHYRGGERQYVSGWHVTQLCRLGLLLVEDDEIDTGSMRAGENRELREDERVYLFVKEDV